MNPRGRLLRDTRLLIRLGGTVPETGTATVVFTDLVGSTELRAEVGDERADDVRRLLDRAQADAVVARGGVVVKGLGDGLMASFGSAADAVAAAIAIQQAAYAYKRTAIDIDIAVRVGLSSGDVVWEDGDCFGAPVIEAARLCAAATGGQILVTEVVRWLAGSGGGYQFTAAGALDLKGLPAPVPACEVTWEPLAESPVPPPALLTNLGRVFVGREGQLERLEQLWKEAAAGELRVALLAGEPGVGKTRLAAELASRV